MKKLFILVVAMGLMLSVIGCRNTVDGVVQDTEDGVDAVQDAVN